MVVIVTEEGIIRKTGNKTFMLQLAAQIDDGEDVNFDEVLEPHDINSLMKVHTIYYYMHETKVALNFNSIQNYQNYVCLNVYSNMLNNFTLLIIDENMLQRF
jgi:hypothetical protein